MVFFESVQSKSGVKRKRKGKETRKGSKSNEKNKKAKKPKGGLTMTVRVRKRESPRCDYINLIIE